MRQLFGNRFKGTSLQPFHLAFPVKNLERARAFYGNILGCQQGREDPGVWIDFSLFGHQIVAHQVPVSHTAKVHSNHVDGHNVPVPHFGLVLKWKEYHEFVDMLKLNKVKFEIEPTIRFVGLPGEQATMFFYDSEGNALEFKAFKREGEIFKKH